MTINLIRQPPRLRTPAAAQDLSMEEAYLHRRLVAGPLMALLPGTALNRTLLKKKASVATGMKRLAVVTPSYGKERLWRTVSRRQCEEAFDWALREMDNPSSSEDSWPAAVEYARSIYRDFRDLRVWRSYQARLKQAGPAAFAERLLTAYDSWARDLRNRVRWHTWRRYGF